MNERTPLVTHPEISDADDEFEVSTDSEEDQHMIVMSCWANVLVCFYAGLIVLSNFVNISSLAERAGTTAEDMGNVFIGVAVTCIIGGTTWPFVSACFSERTVIVSCLVFLLIGTVGIAFCYSIPWLYFWYIYRGIFGACMSTGAYAMIAHVHKGKKSGGPWFTARAIALASSGFIAVLMAAFISNMTTLYLINAGICLCIAIFNYFYQNYKQEDRKQAAMNKVEVTPMYILIVCLSAMSVGCVAGAMSSVTSYLNDYLEDRGMDVSSWSTDLVLLYWTAVVLGQTLVILYQIQCSTTFLLRTDVGVVLSAIVLLSIVLGQPDNEIYLLVTLMLVGFSQGVAEAVCFDIANRLSRPTPIAATLMLFGVNIGVNGSPFLVSGLWDWTSLGPTSLIVVIVVVYTLSLSIQVAAVLPNDRIIE